MRFGEFGYFFLEEEDGVSGLKEFGEKFSGVLFGFGDRRRWG